MKITVELTLHEIAAINRAADTCLRPAMEVAPEVVFKLPTQPAFTPTHSVQVMVLTTILNSVA